MFMAFEILKAKMSPYLAVRIPKEVKREANIKELVNKHAEVIYQTWLLKGEAIAAEKRKKFLEKNLASMVSATYL